MNVPWGGQGESVSGAPIGGALKAGIPSAAGLTASAPLFGSQVRSSPFGLLAAGLSFLLLGLGPNVDLAIVAAIVLVGIWAFFWRPGEPPILFYVFGFQWLQGAIWVLYLNLQDIPIDDGTPMGESRWIGTILVLLGLAAVAVGVRVALGPSLYSERELLELQLLRTPQRTWFGFYVGAFVLAIIALSLGRTVPGLSQPLQALSFFRWGAYTVFTLATFFRRDASRLAWFLVFSLELALSMGGYFATFKSVFLFTFIGFAAARTEVSAMARVGTAVLVSTALVFGAGWQHVKGEYRDFVSLGERSQTVSVGPLERTNKLLDLVSVIGPLELLEGLHGLVARIEYVEYFADVAAIVPKSAPHTDGELWWDAISRPFMPRLLFPEKAIIDESELTNRFATSPVAGMDAGTQVSLGYLTETYLDFGKYLMILVLFLWGLFVGRAYRWLWLGRGSRGVVGLGLAAGTFVMNVGAIENSLAKMVGGLAVSLLVNWVFTLFVTPRWLPLLCAPDVSTGPVRGGQVE